MAIIKGVYPSHVLAFMKKRNSLGLVLYLSFRIISRQVIASHLAQKCRNAHLEPLHPISVS